MKDSLVPPVKGGCQLVDRGVAFQEGQLAGDGVISKKREMVTKWRGGYFQVLLVYQKIYFRIE